MRASVRAGLVAVLLLVAASGSLAAASDDGSTASPAPSPCPSPLPGPSPSSAPVSSAPVLDTSPVPSPSALALDPCASEVTVEAGDLWFRPTEVALPAQGQTTLTLVDGGVIAHNLTVDELDLQLVAAPGRRASATLVDPPAGTYAFYCSISGHREAGMVGTLVVE